MSSLSRQITSEISTLSPSDILDICTQVSSLASQFRVKTYTSHLYELCAASKNFLIRFDFTRTRRGWEMYW